MAQPCQNTALHALWLRSIYINNLYQWLAKDCSNSIPNHLCYCHIAVSLAVIDLVTQNPEFFSFYADVNLTQAMQSLLKEDPHLKNHKDSQFVAFRK